MSPLAPPTSAGTTVRRVLAVALLALIAAAAHYWYGNRHQFYDLRIYWEAVRWWAGGHELYSYAKPGRVPQLDETSPAGLDSGAAGTFSAG